jgi:heme-degrading monooxygenase HmoA
MQERTTYGRVLRLQGQPTKVDEDLKRWKEQIFPLIKKQPGFRGVSLMINRKTGDGLSVAYWDSEKAMKDARAQVRPQADKINEASQRRVVEEDECEVAVQERFKPPKAGVWVRVTTLQADPAKVGPAIETYKSKVVPIVREQPGARAAILLVNRQTGKTFSGTIWETEEDLRKSEAAVTGLRDEIAKNVGARAPKVEAFEIAFTEILTPVGASR